MAGDKQLFQEHLERGSSFAWNGQWERAVHEFLRALNEFPDDMAARTQLAMALYKSGRLQEALAQYQQLWNAQPSNLSLLMRLAEVQEALGDSDAALSSYQLLAEVYLRRRTPKEAVKVWLKAVKISPLDLALWDSLMDAAVQAGALAEIMPLYLNLARDLALFNRFEEAIQVVEKAQTIDPQNGSVLDLLSAIRRALEYSWRAAASGEEVTPAILADIIPPVAIAEPPTDRKATTSQPVSSRPKLTFTVPLERASTSKADAAPQPVPTKHLEETLPLSTTPPAKDVEGDEVTIESPDLSVPSIEQPLPEEQQESQGGAADVLNNVAEVATQSGTGIAERLVEMAETYESLGQMDEAMDAYRQALDISPGLPKALLGLARIHLTRGEIDLVEDTVNQLLQHGDGQVEGMVVPAVEMLLALAGERANRGDLDRAAEILYRLQYGDASSHFPADLKERVVTRSVAIIGGAANTHLEEIVLLPAEARGDVIGALNRIETLLGEGKLRSSADEVYGLVTDYPDFLPAQLLLAGVLVAQGRLKEAEEKAQRLVELYEVRGATRQAQKVVQWIELARNTGGDTGGQLVELQMEESLLEPQVEPEGDRGNGTAEEGDGRAPFWEVMLNRAEINIASGQHDTAAGLVRAALDMDEGRDPAARAALLRILQVMEPNETQRSELAELLQRLDQPQRLAD